MFAGTRNLTLKLKRLRWGGSLVITTLSEHKYSLDILSREMNVTDSPLWRGDCFVATGWICGCYCEHLYLVDMPYVGEPWLSLIVRRLVVLHSVWWLLSINCPPGLSVLYYWSRSSSNVHGFSCPTSIWFALHDERPGLGLNFEGSALEFGVLSATATRELLFILRKVISLQQPNKYTYNGAQKTKNSPQSTRDLLCLHICSQSVLFAWTKQSYWHFKRKNRVTAILLDNSRSRWILCSQPATIVANTDTMSL